MNWKKEPPIKADKLNIGCRNCSTACLEAPMNMTIAVGFGMAIVTEDGKTIYDGERDYQDGKTPKTVQFFEDMALKDPDHDYRIMKFGPMHGETFQRQGVGKWVCIESNEGFA